MMLEMATTANCELLIFMTSTSDLIDSHTIKSIALGTGEGVTIPYNRLHKNRSINVWSGLVRRP